MSLNQKHFFYSVIFFGFVPQSGKWQELLFSLSLPFVVIEILELEQVCWHRSCKYFLGKQNKTKHSSLHKRGWRSAEKYAPFFKPESGS
jgi:hypothetical protein